MANNKSLWLRPEGITGGLFLVAAAVGAVMVADKVLPALNRIVSSSIGLAGGLAVLGGIVYMVLDPKLRNLMWYAYKSVMRWITGVFVQIDPISILKSFIEDLEDNLRKMSKQIGALRGQMRQLRGTFDENAREIAKNLQLAEQAQKGGDERNMALNARKAGRLQDANAKYEILLDKMDILYKMLTRMYENSEIMLEDTRDQVQIRIQEYEAIKTSNSAIQSAMSILKGDPDKRALFDQANEALVDDLSAKVGEMERFMDTSRNLMDSIDLQNGVFQEDGLKLLEQWEQRGSILAAPNKKGKETPAQTLDLNQPRPEPLKEEAAPQAPNRYTDLFD
jgi:phage shock protein A